VEAVENRLVASYQEAGCVTPYKFLRRGGGDNALVGNSQPGRVPFGVGRYARRSREGPCFVCAILAGHPDYRSPVTHPRSPIPGLPALSPADRGWGRGVPGLAQTREPGAAPVFREPAVFDAEDLDQHRLRDAVRGSGSLDG
jgi:hypothetical protein